VAARVNLLLMAAQVAFAINNVAVLELLHNESVMEHIRIEESRHLTDELRRQAVMILPKSEYSVMTRDNIISLIPPDEKEAECLAQSCAIEIGRAIGAEYITQGSIGMFADKFTISVELYETMRGKLLSSIVFESENIVGLLNAIRSEAKPMFQSILDLRPAIASNLDGIQSTSEDNKPPVSVDKKVVTETETEILVPVETYVNEPVKNNEKSGEKNDKSMFSLGFRVGMNTNWLDNYNDTLRYDERESFQLGLVFDFAMNDWFHLQPGIMWISKGGIHEKSTGDPLSYIELPLLVSFKAWAFMVDLGPYFSSNVINRFNHGLHFGGGFDVGNFYIGAFYDHGLSNASKNSDMLWYTRTLGFNLGYNL